MHAPSHQDSSTATKKGMDYSVGHFSGETEADSRISRFLGLIFKSARIGQSHQLIDRQFALTYPLNLQANGYRPT